MIEPASPLPNPPKEYEQNLVIEPKYDIGGHLPPGALPKTVVINDYLPAGEMYVTEREIILSHKGWENLIKHLDLQAQCRVAVHVIVERELGDVLRWLRGAGHEV